MPADSLWTLWQDSGVWCQLTGASCFLAVARIDHSSAHTYSGTFGSTLAPPSRSSRLSSMHYGFMGDCGRMGDCGGIGHDTRLTERVFFMHIVVFYCARGGHYFKRSRARSPSAALVS